MSPPVTSTLWREQDRSDSSPLIIDGHFIPRGTQIGVNIYTLHHNEKYFPDPFTFKPERWLPEETPEHERKTMHEAFVPFSLGYRGCAGKAMAYLESSLVMAKTLWFFDFSVAAGKLGNVGAGMSGDHNGRERTGEFQLFDIFASTHDGPYLDFQVRNEVSHELIPKA